MNIRLWAVATLVLAPALAAAQQTQHELLVFPSVQLVRPSGLAVPNDDLDDEIVSADVLFSLQQGSFRLFGEYLLTNHESDLERLQLGWEASARYDDLARTISPGEQRLEPRTPPRPIPADQHHPTRQ